MEFDLIVTLVTLVGAVVLFATEKLPVDIVALLVTGVLLGFQVVTVEEGIAGFANPAVITVACMFVLSSALQKTGALGSIGRLLSKGGGGAGMLCFLVMLCVAPVSAFVNNTAAVAVFLPLVFAAAAARKVPASRVLIPLSYAAQFGGVCTLIGTSTNLLVNSIAENSGTSGFSMFEFAPLGLIMCFIGGLFLLLFGRWLLPHRRASQLTDTYQLGEYVTELRVMEDSPLVGESIGKTPLSREYDVSILEIRRGDLTLLATVGQVILADDLLLVRGQASKLMAAKTALKIVIEPEFKLKDEALKTTDLQLCEAIIPPGSPYAGRTLEELRLGRRTGVIALAVQRTGHVVREKLGSLRMRFGDALLLLGDREGIDRLRSESGLLILNELDSSSLHRHKAPLALLVMVVVFEYEKWNLAREPHRLQKKEAFLIGIVHGIVLVLVASGVYDVMRRSSAAGVVDVAAEKDRIRKKIEETSRYLTQLEARLGNKDFADRAPAEVVEKEKARRGELESLLVRLRENLELFGSIQ